MNRDTHAKPLPQDLTALLEQTRQDVERYRRLHPEWQPRSLAPSTPNTTGTQ
jgi:hypothetical protein